MILGYSTRTKPLTQKKKDFGPMHLWPYCKASALPIIPLCDSIAPACRAEISLTEPEYNQTVVIKVEGLLLRLYINSGSRWFSDHRPLWRTDCSWWACSGDWVLRLLPKPEPVYQFRPTQVSDKTRRERERESRPGEGGRGTELEGMRASGSRGEGVEFSSSCIM